MTKKKIAVTGATGTHGIRGATTVDALLRAGYSVRALAHTEDARADDLRRRGAEVVVGDFHNSSDMRKLLTGTDGATFSYPMKSGIEAATDTFVGAAFTEKCRFIVNLSLMIAHENSPSPVARGHWRSERAFDASGIETVHVRGAFFYENIFELAGADAADGESITLPFGAGGARIAWVGADDVARFMAALFRRMDEYAGKTCRLVGHVYSFTELAEFLSAYRGVPVAYRGIPFEQWRERPHARKLFDGNPDLMRHVGVLSELFSQERTFGRATPTYENVMGTPPLSFPAFLKSPGR